MYRLIGDPEGEAASRLHLGDMQLASGQPDAARHSWEQALALLAQIPGADTSEARARLCPDPGRPERHGGGKCDRNDRAGSGAVKLHTPVSYVSLGKRC